MPASGRSVRWGAPRPDKFGNAVRESKCGRYRITTRWMSQLSGRNGSLTSRAFVAESLSGPEPSRIGRLHDTLSDALDAVEMDNNLEWEPPP